MTTRRCTAACPRRSQPEIAGRKSTEEDVTMGHVVLTTVNQDEMP